MHFTRRYLQFTVVVFGVYLLRAAPAKNRPQIRFLLIGTLRGRWNVHTLVNASSLILSRGAVKRAHRDTMRLLWHPDQKLLIKARRLAPPHEACTCCLSFYPTFIYPCGHMACVGCVETAVCAGGRLKVETCPSCAALEA